ncbi:MAG: ABC transporter permease subunit [Planctomycetota bacterium]|nr:ABC transporter permease subunit [Planctomycetota bacterium]
MPPSQPDPQAPRPHHGHRRTTPLTAHGTPLVWLMSVSLALCLGMIVTLVGFAAVRGLATFWPKPIQLVTLQSGESFLGIPVREELGVASSSPASSPAGESETRSPAPGAANATPPASVDAAPAPSTQPSPSGQRQRLYRVGNRDLDQPAFRWVDIDQVVSTQTPRDAVLLERREWGVWIGTPKQGDAFDIEAFRAAHESALDRLREIDAITEGSLSVANRGIERARLRERAAELERAKRIDWEREFPGEEPGLPLAAWALVVAGVLACGFAALHLARPSPLANATTLPSFPRRAGPIVLWCLAGALALVAAMEHPWSGPRMTETGLQLVREQTREKTQSLQAEYERIFAEVERLRAADAEHRVEFVDAAGRLAAESPRTPELPMRVSQIVRLVRANDLTFAEKVGVYASRWWEFVSAPPREANTDGGVFPVIFGTVMLTLLLSVAVVPMGVMAALYLREYAPQGLITSLVRIAVNNLAGVPSIVYGVFGLGFFCYTLGEYVDAGPSAPLPRLSWWGFVAGLGIFVALAAILGSLASRGRGLASESRRGWLRRAAATCWVASVGLVITLLATTPYFSGFFEAKLPTPTFGGRGVLWASLTLALLTLPVVIVATEEAIAAVPKSMREGSYGCGASKWQTIRHIVLPQAAPGMMTGAILAMARGAGEVAPLMLVGAVKFAPELPMSLEPPFVRLDQSFMHLGFHIYELGFHSPDSEASRPLVWTATLLLISIVLALNLVAIITRARLRAKFAGSAV